MPTDTRWSGEILTHGHLYRFIDRFLGLTENKRETEMDMREMVDKVKAGEPLYGRSSLSEYMQGVAARNSRYSVLFIHAMPWFNFVNHDQVSRASLSRFISCCTLTLVHFSTESIPPNTISRQSVSLKLTVSRWPESHRCMRRQILPLRSSQQSSIQLDSSLYVIVIMYIYLYSATGDRTWEDKPSKEPAKNPVSCPKKKKKVPLPCYWIDVSFAVFVRRFFSETTSTSSSNSVFN